MSVPAILLAAGASRRLGRPKQLVRIGGETLLARTVRIVRESGAGPVYVVLGAHREAILASVDLSELETVSNADWEKGIASSIQAGVEELERRDAAADAVMLLVCDQPRLTVAHLRELIAVYEESAGSAIVASEYAGIAGIPAIFPKAQFQKLRELQGDSGAKAVLRDSDLPLIRVPFEGGEVDIDTPDDLAEDLKP